MFARGVLVGCCSIVVAVKVERTMFTRCMYPYSERRCFGVSKAVALVDSI
jgi:hypothetical protein